MSSSFGTIFKLTTWGESHGPALGVVIEGCPAGIPLTVEEIQLQLDRRRVGQSKVTTPRGEKDAAEILSGVFEGVTTGAPISLITYNADADANYTGVNNNGVVTFTQKTPTTTTAAKTAADFTITPVTADATAVAVSAVSQTTAGVTAVAGSDGIPVSEGTQFNGTNTLAGGSLTFQVGANATDRITITGTDFSRQGTSKLQDALESTVAVDSAANALTAITAIDDALSEVNTARATFGAIQNRFESVIGNLQIASENVTAAKSRIMDADFAAETAAMTRGQILQQAGTAMLAQANSLPNTVLSLLRG